VTPQALAELVRHRVGGTVEVGPALVGGRQQEALALQRREARLEVEAALEVAGHRLEQRRGRLRRTGPRQERLQQVGQLARQRFEPRDDARFVLHGRRQRRDDRRTAAVAGQHVGPEPGLGRLAQAVLADAAQQRAQVAAGQALASRGAAASTAAASAIA
jgi:hypothetical protein